MADWHLWLPPALTKRRFRLYTAGHLVSVIGGWIQQVALAWLVFRLTQSTFLLGLTGFLLNIFYLLLGPVAGIAADRLPRLPTLIVIDSVLAALSRAGSPSWGSRASTDINAYLAVAALIGIANAFEMPRAPDPDQGHRRGPRAGHERARRQRHGVQPRPHDRPVDRRRAAGLRLGGLVLRLSTR